MANPVESQGEPSGGVARPDYQRRLVPLLGGAVAALALGCLIAPQLDQALHPGLAAALPIQYKLGEAIRLDGELRTAVAAVTMHFADKMQQCGQPQVPVAGQPLRLPPSVLSGGNFSALVGCWQATSGMKNERSGEDLTIEMCFDSKFAQAMFLIEPGGNRCSHGPMNTEVGPRELSVSSRTALECRDGKTYNAPTVVCRPGADDIAECQVRSGSSRLVPLQFTRK